MKTKLSIILTATLLLVHFTVAYSSDNFDTTSLNAGLYLANEDAAPSAVVITGEVTAMGLTGPFEIILTSDGRFRWDTDTQLQNYVGFDGETAWERDWNGTPRVMQHEQHDRSVMETLLWSGAWSRGHDGDGLLSLGSAIKGESGQQTIPYTFGDRGMKGLITIDPSNAEVVAFTCISNSTTQEFTLEDFQEFDSVRWPSLITTKVPDTADTIFRTTHVSIINDAKKAAQLLEPNLNLAENFRFKNDAPADLEIKRAPTGHLLVHPLLDGKDIGWFIFDTGAGAIVLDNEAAVELGYEHFGDMAVKGVGGRVNAGFYRGNTIQVGRLEMDDPTYLGLDLAFLSNIMGEKIAGIVGYGVLSRAVVEFEVATPRIGIHDASTYELSEGNWGEMLLSDRVPNVTANFEGHEGVFKLDTGADGTITFHQPTTERLQLLKNRRLQDTNIGGVGGSVKGKTGLLQEFTLGGEAMNQINVQFAIEAKGVFANAYTDGNVGTQLLNPFVMVFDYQQTRIAFVKR